MYQKFIEQYDKESLMAALSGNLDSMLPSRISYFLNLKGPALIIDTACSSSLVSVYMAYKEIRDGSCQMALAGGINLSMFPIDTGVLKSFDVTLPASDSSVDIIQIRINRPNAYLQSITRKLCSL